MGESILNQLITIQLEGVSKESAIEIICDAMAAISAGKKVDVSLNITKRTED